MNPVDTRIYAVFVCASFALGACIASFLNVVIWRVPRGESIVRPPSHCPRCQTPIRWYQNIPILSWLALRGRCARCHTAISPRYILIETLGGLLFLAAFWKVFDFSLPSILTLFVMWCWIALMIVGSFIDFDHKLLPDFVTIGGMILGLVAAGAETAFLFHTATNLPQSVCWTPLLSSVGGLALGLGLLGLVRYFGSKAFRREAMGLGDVLLMGAVGALFGPVAVLFTLIGSSLLGSVIGLTLVALSRTKLGRFTEIPYGPYICAACLVWFFHGHELVVWYLKLLRAS